MKKYIKLLLLTFLAVLSVIQQPAFGKASDSNAPIEIEADQVEMRERESTSTYTGNVKISKGTIRFTGDKIIITSKDGQLQHIEIEGTPATFFQLNDLNEEISAQSFQMLYLANNNTLELTKQALLIKDHSQFSSEHIIYDAQNDVVKAGEKQTVAGDEKTRVKIILHPENKTDEAKQSAEQP